MRMSDLAEAISALSRPCIVAIDGFGGAGKSTLAAALALDPGGTVIHTDDFASWDEPIDWWPRMLEQVFRPLASGQPARFQRYDWELRALAEWHTVEPGLVIIEGVTSSRVEFREYLSYSVWVDTPRDIRLARGLERDGAAALDQWLGWMRAEDDWAAAQHPRSHANFVVAGTASLA